MDIDPQELVKTPDTPASAPGEGRPLGSNGLNNLVAIAVAMLAVTALTGRRWLYGLTLLPTAYGIAMGMAGLTGGSLHPDALIRLLS